MKHLLSVCLWTFLLSGIVPTYAQVVTPKPKNSNVETVAMNTSTNNGVTLNMPGAYTMLRQQWNDGKKDTSLTMPQLKIYTDRYYMFAHPIPGDSLAQFGIGTYRMENGKVLESPIDMDAAQQAPYELSVTKNSAGYTQVIHFPADSAGIKYVLTEDYRNVSKAVTSPLDGAWKQTGTTYITKEGTTTVDNHPIQYKMFQSGYYMWANTYKDSATQKPLSNYGYGTFSMNGQKEASEVATNSTFTASLVGKPVVLQLAFTGKDTYQQTILWPDGGKSIEVYQRLK